MAVALEQFVKQLADSGVIAPGKLEKFVPPQGSSKDAQELARQLVQSKQLTKYQVQEIYLGRAKSLILGNYTILEKLGAGGMGQVFKAEHRRMHRTVAIKILPKAAVKSVSAIARFQREAEAAARLTHPNIVAAYDSDEANDVHFIAMEYVEGSDLAALVKKDGPLSVRRAVNYIMQAARGLEFAHGEGVVHRDIKPANLLLDKKGTVKILDMGLAHVETNHSAAAHAESTGSGAIGGSVDYMAPEQGLSSKMAGARADTYSLGCTLHFLLTGKPIYDGDTVAAKLLAHQQQPIPDLCKLNDEVPDQLQSIFRKMVAKKIEARYQTMSEVVAALEAYEASTSGLQHSASVLDASDSNLDLEALSFLGDMPKSTIHKRKSGHSTLGLRVAEPIAESGAEPAPEERRRGNRKLFLGIVAGAVLVLATLAALVVSLRGTAGTLVVRINLPNVTVQVLNEAGDVETSESGVDGKISIPVRPGKHSLQVEKQGFQLFTQDFVMESGGDHAIKVFLERATKNVAAHDPSNEPWTRELAGLPAEKRLEAVVKKLRQLNPDFDGKEEHKIENDLVKELSLSADSLADISPVRALTGLKTLKCAGSGGGALRFSDLTPLRGMHLVNLNCDSTSVSELSPLEGMELATLRCSNTHVADLSPLRGMPLRELSCGWTGVADLWPLAGMHLTRLEVDGAPVPDLRPLKGMPLSVLRCSSTRVFDLSPLRGMPLKELDCFYTRVTDVAPLEGMKLSQLGFDANSITNGIEAVRGMKGLAMVRVGRDDKEQFPTDVFWKKYDAGEFPASPEMQMEAVVKKLRQLNPEFDGAERHAIDGATVTELQFSSDKVADISPVRALTGLKKLTCNGNDFSNNKLSDLSPLKGMKLISLECGATHVSDLSPLKGMPLSFFNCGTTRVTDLSPLKDMPLTKLWIDTTPIADLSALKGMPLVELRCSRTPIADLGPLKGMPLTALYCYETQLSDLSPLAGMPLKQLDIGSAKVSDLSPLKGAPLKILHCYNDAGITDLSPLRGMPLTILSFNGTQVSDLSPLKGMNLTTVDLSPKKFGNGLSVLRQMKSLTAINADWQHGYSADEFWKKLDAGEFNAWDTNPVFAKWVKDVGALPADRQVSEVVARLLSVNPRFDSKETHKIENSVVIELHFSSDQVTDISPVRALAELRGLYCGGGSPGSGQVSDLSPLRGMALTGLKCSWSQVSDLSPLAGMHLTYLDCGGTQVHDLSPLHGMPLTGLWCNGLPVSDLSPLAGMPLKNLYCDATKVSDLSPLAGMQLAVFTLTPKNITKGMNAIRQMQSLDRIGIGWQPQDLFSPADFWKKYDAGEFNK